MERRWKASAYLGTDYMQLPYVWNTQVPEGHDQGRVA